MTLVYNDIKTLNNILFAQLNKLISSQLICYAVDIHHLFHIVMLTLTLMHDLDL